MLRTNVPRAVRHLRRNRGWRQVDLGTRAGVSREVVSRIERGALGGLTIKSLENVIAALDASVDLTVRWRGEELDRLADASHAHLVQLVAQTLSDAGWTVKVEVSFNHYGDRGRVDVLAFHAPARTLMVVEVKSALGDLQDTIGRFDVKARLGQLLADGAGWGSPRSIVPALVIGDARRARRTVATHPALFARYAVRGRSAVAWLHRPQAPAPSGLLWFANLPHSHAMRITRNGRVRTSGSSP